MRSIVLEILRDGTPHNQLLSPLTKYMVLCGEHAATALQLPFEHAQWLARMGGLTYRDSEETRQLQVADVAGVMATLLDQIPGLVSELARCRLPTSVERMQGIAKSGAARTVHLRLVLNAHELSLLPFELANAPSGVPAAGQSLCLQTEVPLSVTREVRRAGAIDADWTLEPKVLFAFADPGAPVPYEQHLLALRQAIDPWVFSPREGSDEDDRRRAVAGRLTVLPQATVQAIEMACKEGDYTHVHILAHGIQMRRGDDRRFGLALHDSVDRARIDVVDGERLAAALRPHLPNRSQSLAGPLVVSLASCDSGNAGSVIGAGASIAHELHIKGIPLVVASQFPLTVTGSIRMVKVLFDGLLWGEDPRCVLDDLRRQLKSLLPASHDWASLVAYADFPPDIADQCDRLAYDQARRSIDAALDTADRIIDRMISGDGSAGHDGVTLDSIEDIEQSLAPEFRKLEAAAKKLRNLLNTSTGHTAQIHGRLAATHKRIAQLLLGTARLATNPTTLSDTLVKVRGRLEGALHEYELAFAASRDDAWAQVQTLVLAIALDHPLDAKWSDAWTLSRLLSKADLSGDDALERFWALGNLIELHLLATIPKSKVTGDGKHEERALGYANQLAESYTRKYALELKSTRRQLERYSSFFALFHDRLGKLAPLAKRILARLPEPDASDLT